ncbi:MAG: hypothetical protein WC887_01655 [Candidatus Paceibacterota bacterium]|jgi:hypothetical protein
MDQHDESSGIVFENDQFQQSTRSFRAQTPKIVQLVINYSGGLVKNERQTNYVLLGFSVLAIIVSVFLVFGGNGSAAPINVDPLTGMEIIPGQVPGGI